MKVSIQNLGAIQNAEIDLKPLTILIGPNNAGKTWTAYVLAGILGSHGRSKYAEAYIAEELTEQYPPLDNAIKQVLAEGSTTLNLVEFAEHYGEQYFQSVTDYAHQWMSDFMSTQFAVFDNMKVSVNLAASKTSFLEQVKQSTIQVDVAGGAFIMDKKEGNPILQAYTSVENGEAVTEKIPPEEIKKRLVRRVMRVLHQALYSEIQVFPTERTTLVTLGMPVRSPITVNAKTKELFEAAIKILQGIKDLNIPTPEPKQGIGPVGYFASMLGSLFNMGSRAIKKREEEARNNPKIQRYQQLAQILEEQVLNGNLDFSTPEPDPRRDILFHPRHDVALEMQIASSMVKELAPLALYLRYLAQPNELLIIDEPEMNLHPEAQAQMIEFLCLLVKAGLRVLVTTHSTYLVDHLINLMYAATHPQEEQAEQQTQEELAEVFFLETADAFIPEENVAVYLLDHGVSKNILHDTKIDWSTFGNVSDQVSRIYFTL